MAKKKRTKRQANRPASPATAKPRTPIERARDVRLAAIRADWAAIHPERAAAERGLRKAHAAAQTRWSHKRNGTPETHEHASRVRQGALARLYMSGAIDAEQLAAGAEIAAAAALIMREVDVRTANYEPRVTSGRDGHAFHEALGRVWVEVAYSRWRAELGVLAPIVLSIVIDDLGLVAAAARHHVSARKARAVMIDGLQRWIRGFAQTRREVDHETLARAQAAIL